jgi:hypothetical protein
MTLAKVLATSDNYRMLAINKDNSHYAMAQRLNIRHTRIGVAATVTGALASTAVFATVSESSTGSWRIGAGLVAAVGAVLAALQTFLKFSEQAQLHTASAAGYSRLRRQLEIFQLRYEGSNDQVDALQALDAFRSELDALEQSSPPIPEDLYKVMRDRFAHERKGYS